MQQSTPTTAGILLCGGRSARMGADKASLRIGSRSLLAHMVHILGEVVSPLVIVAAEGQLLPADAGDLEVVHDSQPGQGPLEGIRAGLAALQGRAEQAYVTGVDYPLLRAAFVRDVISRLDAPHQIALPCEAERHHTLAAVYRLSVLAPLEALLAAGERRPAALYAAVATRRIEVEQLRGSDPALDSLVNCNRPTEYAAALRSLGLPETSPE